MAYTIGLDFGTGSVRGVVTDVRNGHVLAVAERPYAVYETLPGTHAPIKAQMALADPAQYLRAMEEVVRESLRACGVSPLDVTGIGADTTSLTLVAVGADGRPLCMDAAFSGNPHAYMKLWKSRSAEREAAQVLRTAQARREPALPWNGGGVNSEWLIPKALETFHDAPAVFEAADLMMDLTDYIPYVLSGAVTRNVGSFAYKAMGYDGRPPSQAFLEAVEPGFGALRAKLRGRSVRWGDRIGSLLPDVARRLGLQPGIAVSAGALDGNVPLLALGLQSDGDMLLTLGTSGVMTALSSRCAPVEGCAGGAQDAAVPGLYSCECGMAAMGDLYGWVVQTCMPPSEWAAAEQAGLDIHGWLAQRALQRAPQPSDVMALDWWNGHRGPFARRDVTGVLVGMTLQTTAQDIYRAAVEATAFCARLNLENLTRQGIAAGRIAVCGGIARKNPTLVQLFCDVLGHDLYFSDIRYEAAVGAAVMAANAADTGESADLPLTSARMAAPFVRVYHPDGQRHAAFTARYERYLQLARLMQDHAQLVANDPSSAIFGQ